MKNLKEFGDYLSAGNLYISAVIFIIFLGVNELRDWVWGISSLDMYTGGLIWSGKQKLFLFIFSSFWGAFQTQSACNFAKIHQLVNICLPAAYSVW